MKRLALVGFPDVKSGVFIRRFPPNKKNDKTARQDITPTKGSRDSVFDESYTDPATPHFFTDRMLFDIINIKQVVEAIHELPLPLVLAIKTIAYRTRTQQQWLFFFADF
jgi:hypothetical protein